MSYSEKDTDYYLQREFVSVFNEKYNTGSNSELFGSLKPDGWFLLTPSVLLIIENKQSIINNEKAQKQVIRYATCVYNNSPTIELIICINGFGTNEDDFIYIIYEFTRKYEFVKSKIESLDELYDLYDHAQPVNDMNQTLQSLHNLIVKKTNITTTKDLSLFTAFCILSCKLPSIRQIINETSNNAILFSTLEIEFSRFYDNDEVILTLFNIPKLKTIDLKPILKITSKLPNTSINDLFKQYCKYTKDKQDKNIELTPTYVSDVMMSIVDSQYQDYESIIDPFAGSSSLLLNSKPSAQKILIEKETYMYLISKLNLEINNIKNYKLIHDDMQHVDFHANVCITNPPYTKKLSGKDAIDWLCQLINKVNVIVAIIPTSNISNSPTYNKFKQQFMTNNYFLRYVVNCGKCFKNVNVEASIIVLDNLKPKTPYHIFDLTFKYKIDYTRPPLHDMILLQPGIDKINNIKNDVNYIEVLEYDHESDWSCQTQTTFDLSCQRNIFMTELLTQIRYYFEEPSKINNERFGLVFDAINETMNNDPILNTKSFNKIKISSLFRPVKKIHNYNYKTTNLPIKDEKHVVPMFACKKLNNGIAGYVEHEEHEGNVIVVVKSRNATCGYSFHYSGKLAWSSFNLVIEPIKPMTNDELDLYAQYMTNQLAPNHTDKESFNINELMDKIILIPANE